MLKGRLLVYCFNLGRLNHKALTRALEFLMRNWFPNNQIKGHLVLGAREHNHAADPEDFEAKQARAKLREGVEETGGSVADAVHQVVQMRDQMKGNPSLSLSQVVGETPVNFNVEALKQAARWQTRKFKERKRSQAHFISDHWELEDMVDDPLAEDIKKEPFESYQSVWSFGFVMGNNICEKNQSHESVSHQWKNWPSSDHLFVNVFRYPIQEQTNFRPVMRDWNFVRVPL